MAIVGQQSSTSEYEQNQHRLLPLHEWCSLSGLNPQAERMASDKVKLVLRVSNSIPGMAQSVNT